MPNVSANANASDHESARSANESRESVNVNGSYVNGNGPLANVTASVSTLNGNGRDHGRGHASASGHHLHDVRDHDRGGPQVQDFLGTVTRDSKDLWA